MRPQTPPIRVVGGTLWRSIMENVIVIDEAIVRAMVEARAAGLTFEQFVEMVNVAHEQYAILPD